MVRTFVRGGCLAAAIFLLGCGGKPANAPFAVNHAEAKKPSPTSASTPATPSTAPPVATLKDDPVSIPAVVLPADSPEGFRGEDLAEATLIPPEIQQDLKSYSDAAHAKMPELLLNPHPLVRVEAASRLGYLPDDVKAMLPQAVLALRGALRDKQAKVRTAAAESLNRHVASPEAVAKAGDVVGTAVPELTALLLDSDAAVCAAALDVLNNLGPRAAPALPQLLAVVRTPDYQSRVKAVDVVGSIGDAAKGAVPILVPMVAGGEVGYAAGRSLGKLGADAELLQALSDSNENRVHAAVGGVPHLKPPSAAITAKLIEITLRPDNRADDTLKALGKIRPTTKEISNALATVLQKHESAWMRRYAVYGLGDCDPKFDEAVPVLLAATSDPDKDVCEAATAAMGGYQGSVEVRLQVILDQILRDGDLFWTAKSASLKKGAKEFGPLLKKIVQDPQADEARRAVALFSMEWTAAPNSGPERTADFAELTTLARPWLGSGVPATMRSAAATMLERLNDGWDPAWEAAWIEGTRRGKFVEGRILAVEELGGSRSAAALDAVVAALNDPAPKVAVRAAERLGDKGPAASAAVEGLIKLAGQPKIEDRTTYIRTLGKIGARPEISVPFLTKLLDDKEDHVPTAALKSLAQIVARCDLDAAPTIAAAEKLLASDEDFTRSQSVEALGALGPKGAPAVPKLLDYLKTTKDDFYRKKTVEALGAIGPGAAAAAPALIEGVDHWKEPETPLAALAKIKQGGAALAKLAPKLFQKVELRRPVLETLGEMGAEAKGATPAIIELLDSKEDLERSEAIRTLGKIGPSAKEATAKLKKLAADDPVEYVRSAAVETLSKLDPAAAPREGAAPQEER